MMCFSCREHFNNQPSNKNHWTPFCHGSRIHKTRAAAAVGPVSWVDIAAVVVAMSESHTAPPAALFATICHATRLNQVPHSLTQRSLLMPAWPTSSTSTVDCAVLYNNCRRQHCYRTCCSNIATDSIVRREVPQSSPTSRLTTRCCCQKFVCTISSTSRLITIFLFFFLLFLLLLVVCYINDENENHQCKISNVVYKTERR